MRTSRPSKWFRLLMVSRSGVFGPLAARWMWMGLRRVGGIWWLVCICLVFGSGLAREDGIWEEGDRESGCLEKGGGIWLRGGKERDT